MNNQYVVTEYVKRLGRRDTISQPMSLEKANSLSNSIKKDMKLATKKHRWARDLKVKKI